TFYLARNVNNVYIRNSDLKQGGDCCCHVVLVGGTINQKSVLVHATLQDAFLSNDWYFDYNVHRIYIPIRARSDLYASPTNTTSVKLTMSRALRLLTTIGLTLSRLRNALM